MGFSGRELDATLPCALPHLTMARRVPARVRPLFSYAPVGHGGRGPRIIETEAICSRCHNEAWVRGAGPRSRRAACVMLRLSCPRKETNYYSEAF